MSGVLLISILLLALIYLHFKGSDLIFQSDIKVVKVLSIIVLALMGIFSDLVVELSGGELAEIVLICRTLIWFLIVIAYCKLFSGCYKYISFNRVGSADPAIRVKVRGILQDVLDKQELSAEWDSFLKASSSDPLVEEIRCGCKRFWQMQSSGEKLFEKEDFDKLKEYIEKLAE